MNAMELVIWGMALGANAAVGIARLADLVARPSRGQLGGIAYHAAIFVFVLLLCGIPREIWPQLGAGALHTMQVLVGPFSAGLSAFWMRGWLNASQRDRLMANMLLATAALLPAAGVACLALPRTQQLPAAAIISTLAATVALWLAVRAWLMGDRLALAMAAGRALVLPAILGLHAIAIGLPGIGIGLHALIAACSALGNGLIGFVLWRRDRHEWRTQADDLSQYDPVTKLRSGAALVRKLIHAQRRRRRTRRDGAVLAIMVFDVDRIAAQVGTGGLNEMFITLASRIQRQVGVVNPVGRYYDRCFISLVETIQSPAWLRTLGLRVASSARRPLEVTALDGQRVEVRPDIGVGVVHLAPGATPVEDILHDAQRMAEAARSMRSRAAIFDAASGDVVPVEQANLGPRRHGHPDHVPHAVAPLTRAQRA